MPDDTYTSELVEAWGDYVDWDRRRAGEEGFLVGTLNANGCRRVLDAATGDGVDSIHLMKNGFDVTSSDRSALFLEKAAENSRINGFGHLNAVQSDWRELEGKVGCSCYDAAFCLGNSFTHLFGRDDQLKALANFRNVLRPGGVLLIDERNYQYYLDNRKEILDGGKYRYSGKYLYCGDKVRGRPVEITDDRVRIDVSDDEGNKRGQFVLYPFKRGELEGLLKEAGFSKIEQYSDYKPGFNPDADFYQYVCVK